jgi:hypothetical protein
MSDKSYLGHRNWNHWNVALWIANDEPLYRRAVALKRVHGSKGAAIRLMTELPEQTPDGARYSLSALTAAVRGLE